MNRMMCLMATLGALPSVAANAPQAAVAPTDWHTVAVLPLNDRIKDGTVDRDYFSDVVRSEVARTKPWLAIMDKESVFTILQSSGKDVAECTEQCEAELGRTVGADLIIAGDLLRLGSGYRLTLRLRDTRSGLQQRGEQAQGRDAAELEAETRRATRELIAVVPAPPSHWLSKTLIGGGVVAGAASGLLGLRAKTAAESWSSATSFDTWQNNRSTANDSARLATIGWAVAGSLLVAGIALLGFTNY